MDLSGLCSLQQTENDCLLQGVRLAYYNSDADVLLMQIPSVIPDHFKVRTLGKIVTWMTRCMKTCWTHICCFGDATAIP